MILVIPCYNEEKRLDGEGFARIVQGSPFSLLFVDDGSTDQTGAMITGLLSSLQGRGEMIRIPRNVGKGEAVRRGMLHALSASPEIIGYADADLSTPPDEIVRLARIAVDRPEPVVMGARVRLLGREIQRKPFRHYAGRLFATAASLALRLPVYDTQCGAKFFRVTPPLASAISRPFTSRWGFDVELISRLLLEGYGSSDFLELPLLVWRDVGGSKLRLLPAIGAALHLVRLGIQIRRGRG